MLGSIFAIYLVVFADNALNISLPVGASPEAANALNKVAYLTVKNDYAAARQALRLLPSRSVRVEWDDSAAADSAKADYLRQRDIVFHEWSMALASSKYQVVKSGGDLRVQFVPSTGVTLEWSDKEGVPRLT